VTETVAVTVFSIDFMAAAGVGDTDLIYPNGKGRGQNQGRERKR